MTRRGKCRSVAAPLRESDPVNDAARFLRRWLGEVRPRWGVVLGSGLGRVSASLEGARSVEMAEIPGFPTPTSPGHAGIVRFGYWGEEQVLLFEGRTHLYEGGPVERVERPVRILKSLDVQTLILTNAVGSLDRRMPPGSLMRACDLIGLFFRPRRSEPPDTFPPRCGVVVPRTVFDSDLGARIDVSAREIGLTLHRGVLGGTSGPAYETVSEIQLLRRSGVDAVCMSTIPEALLARSLGIRVATVSLITNYATGIDRARCLDHEEVLSRAAAASADLARLLGASISRGETEE